MKEQTKESKTEMIHARGIIPIFFSTVSNTSKRFSFQLQEKLEKQGFLVMVTNIGDVDRQQFLEMTGLAIFLLSTFGNGGSPTDGEQFMGWVKSLSKNNHFSNLQFVILGLGNQTFERFCGNSVGFREALLANGAKQLIEFVKCSSASTEESIENKFPEWSKNLIEKLVVRYEMKEMRVGDLLQKYSIIVREEMIKQSDWEQDVKKWENQLGKQFIAYYKAFKTDIIHIKQLRRKNDGRSTLWIRMHRPEGLKIEPGSNINIYPENVRKSNQKQLNGSIQLISTKKKSKIPYPPMNLQQLWKISNFNQTASTNLVKFALAMSREVDESIKNKYYQYLKDPQLYEKNPVRCWQLYDVLNPGVDFIVKIGVNTVRPYTLASWDLEQNYIDLIVGVDPLGLTSRYLQSEPLYLKILPTSSQFYVPSGRPIVMVCNGTGIAPFRSLIQYFVHGEMEKPKLYLYFGFQSKEIDFYFKEQWEELQQKGKIVLKVAESRVDPVKKVYVQDLLKEDRNFITSHLFENKGVIFICGSAEMGKAVEGEIFEAIKKIQKIPFKAFKLLTQMQKNKTIVKQIFS